MYVVPWIHDGSTQHVVALLMNIHFITHLDFFIDSIEKENHPYVIAIVKRCVAVSFTRL